MEYEQIFVEYRPTVNGIKPTGYYYAPETEYDTEFVAADDDFKIQKDIVLIPVYLPKNND